MTTASRAIALLCPVRGCAQALQREPRQYRCPAGHSFDLARSGYCSLLQPQDKRSKTPGDSAEIAMARRRIVDAGLENAAVDALIAQLQPLCPRGARLLDLGCGEGGHLARIVTALGACAHGLDLSAAALRLAAQRHARQTEDGTSGIAFFAVNADRRLPYADHSFEGALSLTGRWNPAELRRVLLPNGLAAVCVPGGDDLIELREAVLGEGRWVDRVPSVLQAFEPHFELRSQQQSRVMLSLEPDALRDLLTATYRGARHSQQQRLASLPAMQVCSSRELLLFAPKAPR